MPDFRIQPSFPISSVIDAASRNAELQEQARQEGNKSILEGLQGIGQVGQSLFDTRKRVAQSLAIGRHLGVPDEISRTLDPSEVLSTAAAKNKIPDTLQTVLLLNPSLANNPAIIGLMQSMVPQQPQAPAATTPAATGIGGATTSAAPPTPPAVSSSSSTATSPTNLLPTLLGKPMTVATANLATKIALASKPQSVFQATPDGLKLLGKTEKGDHIISSQPGAHQDNEYDKLEGQVINRIAGVRGDRSLARVEEQRDASIQAYNTIAQVKAENRLPNQLEYYDILGQMWKARTGQSPSDQAIRDLDAKTLKGDIGKAYQYFSGNAAPRTTAEIMGAIQNFAKQSGQQADKLHNGYMQSHLVKPKNMSQADFDNIVSAHRGLTFAEGTAAAPAGNNSGLSPDESKFIADYEAKHGIKQ